MHELSIALSIIEGVEEELARHTNTQVTGVYLRLGPLSGVVKEALLFSWDVACEGTPLEGAKLQIEEMATGAELQVFALELKDLEIEDKAASVREPSAYGTAPSG